MTSAFADRSIIRLRVGDEVSAYLRDGALAVGTVEHIAQEGLYLTGTLQIDGSAGRGDSAIWLPVGAILAVVIAP